MSKLTLTGYFKGQQAKPDSTDDFLTVTFDGPLIVVVKDEVLEVHAGALPIFTAPFDHPAHGFGSIENRLAYLTWRDK